MSADRRGNLRVVILTAAVGAGHNGPACELAERLTAVGHDVEVVDLIDIAPAAGPARPGLWQTDAA